MEAAAEHDFALFEVPYELPFIALTEKAFTHLVNEQYAVLRRALAAHERLERIVLSEQGLDGVARALSALIGGPALIFDGRGEELASSGAEPRVAAELGAELRERTRAGARRGFAPGGELEGRALALPGRARGRRRATARRRRGWSPRRRPGTLTEFDRLTLHQAVTIVALELLRRRMADDTERRLAGDVLTALVAGRARGRGPRAPAGAVRARRPRGHGRARAAAAGQVRGRGRARARGARRGGRRAGRRDRAASRAR